MELMKENFIPQNKTNRSRGENWTQEEKDLLLEIMRKSAPIVENKLTDTNTNRRKKLEWVNIQNKLKELTGKPRDIAQLKGFWRRSKVAAKKSVSQHRRALQATGGGQRPPSPSPEDLKILEYCPTDFVIDENDFDSDSVLQATVPDEAPVDGDTNTLEKHNNSVYDIDEDFEIMELGETVTLIPDKHNEEIDQASVNIQQNEVKVLSELNVKRKYKTEIGTASNVEQNEIKVFSDLKVKRPDTTQARKKITSKAALLESNIEIKKQATEMMEKEHELKIKYHRQELAHQQLRHKLEVDLYLLDKEKKQLEIQLLKKKLNKE